MGEDGTTIEEPGVVVRERPANQTEYVILGNEVYVTQQPADMEAFSRTVMEASQAGSGGGRSQERPPSRRRQLQGSSRHAGPEAHAKLRAVQVNAETGKHGPSSS
jgi:hypothetical protein